MREGGRERPCEVRKEGRKKGKAHKEGMEVYVGGLEREIMVEIGSEGRRGEEREEEERGTERIGNLCRRVREREVMVETGREREKWRKKGGFRKDLSRKVRKDERGKEGERKGWRPV